MRNVPDQLTELDLITTAPSDKASPGISNPKKDGKNRFVVAYLGLNK